MGMINPSDGVNKARIAQQGESEFTFEFPCWNTMLKHVIKLTESSSLHFRNHKEDKNKGENTQWSKHEANFGAEIPLIRVLSKLAQYIGKKCWEWRTSIYGKVKIIGALKPEAKAMVIDWVEARNSRVLVSPATTHPLKPLR